MEKLCREWCKEHNATLISVGTCGFGYMTYTGEVWWMPFYEM